MLQICCLLDRTWSDALVQLLYLLLIPPLFCGTASSGPTPPPGLTISVPRSMQRMVTVPRGRGILAMMNSRKGVISGMLLVRVYAMDFFKLSKIRRPAERL